MGKNKKLDTALFLDRKTEVSSTAKVILCPKCRSDKITYQAVTKDEFKKKSFWWWIFIGWWWIIIELIFWVLAFLPTLLIKHFSRSGKNKQTKVYTIAICQNCGHSWKSSRSLNF